MTAVLDGMGVTDLVRTSPERLDDLVSQLRILAFGFFQAGAMLTGAAGLPVWFGPAASEFDQAAGGVSSQYGGLNAELGNLAEVVAGYARAVRVARDAAWWAVEGMEQARNDTRQWQAAVQVWAHANPLTPLWLAHDQGLPNLPALHDPGDAVRGLTQTRWAGAWADLAAAGQAAAAVCRQKADLAAQDPVAGFGTQLLAGIGGEMLQTGSAGLAQLKVFLPWDTLSVLATDASGIEAIGEHPVAFFKGITHWDEWSTNPGGAAGECFVDLASLVLLKKAGVLVTGALDARVLSIADRAALGTGDDLMDSVKDPATLSRYTVLSGLVSRGLDETALAKAYLDAKRAATLAAVSGAVSAATGPALDQLAVAKQVLSSIWGDARRADPEAGALSLSAPSVDLDETDDWEAFRKVNQPGGASRLADLADGPMTSGHPGTSVPLGGSDAASYPLKDDYQPQGGIGNQAGKPKQDVLGLGSTLTPADFMSKPIALTVFEAATETGFGGHTLARHVGKSLTWLKERLASDTVVTRASSFFSQDIAEDVLTRLRDHDAAEIKAWIGSGAKTGEFKASLADLGFPSPGDLGLLVVKSPLGDVVVTPTEAVIRLTNYQGGIRVLTGMLN